MLNIPPLTQCQLSPFQDEWCEFHKTRGHSTKEYKLSKSQFEKCLVETVTKRKDDLGIVGGVSPEPRAGLPSSRIYCNNSWRRFNDGNVIDSTRK
ncbi:hypothetical protein CR513_32539, partial [Mucuna pruriens]